MKLTFIKRYTIVYVILTSIKSKDGGSIVKKEKFYKEHEDMYFIRKNMNLQYIPKTQGGPKLGEKSFYYYIESFQLIPITTN